MNDKQSYKKHQEMLEKQFHITGHEKADMLYETSKELGNGSFPEIESIYAELINLIK